MADPLVSIAIPTYRGAEFLPAAVDSVLGQSYRNVELWVIDDNSPDATAEIMARYTDPRVRYLRNAHNLGPEGNWNRCLEVAQGKYFKLLPHDDVLADDCLRRQVSVLENDTAGRIALVFGSRTIIDPQGRRLMSRGPGRAAAGRLSGPALARRCVRAGTNLIGEPGNGLCRVELARRIGGYDASLPYVVDLDYWFRLLMHGDAHYTAVPTSSFRISPGSWSVALGGKQALDFERFIEKYRAEPRFGITRADCLVGRLKAQANSIARALVYKYLFFRMTAAAQR